jgi:rhodanese-related sulfurtransferase
MSGPQPDAAEVLATDVDPADGSLLLDVRESYEWLAGHVAGAVHVPLGQLTPDHPVLEPGRAIVCICRSGARSGRATRALNAWGFDAVNLVGGMQAWAAVGRPVVDDDGNPGAVV